MFFERRNRIKRPKTLLFFGLLFLCMPFLNYSIIQYQMKNSMTDLMTFITGFGIGPSLIMLMPIVIGFGLLSVKKWSWYLFIIFTPFYIGYNIYIAFQSNTGYNFATIAVTIFGFGSIYYFLKKDIAAPYFNMYPRGWRGQKRLPIHIEVVIDGKSAKTKDFSERGFLVDNLKLDKKLNDEVNIILQNVNNGNIIKGGIARIQLNEYGIAFREVGNDLEKDLKAIK